MGPICGTRNPIVDRTGLEGTYQFDLEFSHPRFPSDRPELGVALQQQLGLKLERRKEPMDVLVIDHLERAFAQLIARIRDTAATRVLWP